MTATRSAPPPATSEELTAEFWAATRQGLLVRPVCHACGHNFFTPKAVCPQCRSADWDYVPSRGRGRVLSHTTVHRGPDPSWPVPYVIGVVDVVEEDGGSWYLLTRLLTEPPAEEPPGALIGREVQVVFLLEDRPPHRTLPAFALSEELP